MALVRCDVSDCPNQVREGLKRHPLLTGVNGQRLADGRTCWRCRARQASKQKPKRKSFPVTDPDLDAPDGAVVDGFERVGNRWEPRDP